MFETLVVSFAEALSPISLFSISESFSHTNHAEAERL